MSTNLTCSVFVVLQTPSHITAMILSDNDKGEYAGGVDGVAKRYISWCSYQRQDRLNANLQDTALQASIEEHWTSHIRDFKSAMQAAAASGKAVKFGAL